MVAARALAGLFKSNLFGRQWFIQWTASARYLNAKPRTARKSVKSVKFEKELKPRLPGIPQYEKLGENSSEFKRTMMMAKSRSARERKQLFAVEGKRIISDAIKAGFNPQTIFFSKEENLVGIDNLQEVVNDGVRLKKVFYEDIKLFSDVVTSPGVMGVFKIPDQSPINREGGSDRELPIVLIADNIRDPGNMGSVIRIAAACGVSRIVCTKGCVDIWENKVIRTACGAHFRIPIVNNVDWPFMLNHIPVDKLHKIYLADNAEDLCGDQRNEESELLTESNVVTTKDEESGQEKIYDQSYGSSEILSQFEYAKLESQIFTNVDYFVDFNSSNISALIVGGETRGLSAQAYKFAKEYNGLRVKIPLAFGVESLNNSIAAAVILYEIRRQMENKAHNM